MAADIICQCFQGLQYLPTRLLGFDPDMIMFLDSDYHLNRI
jgi:hypothetical protein